ncbi:MAG: hypothetical protein ABIC57_01285 [bacterium]
MRKNKTILISIVVMVMFLFGIVILNKVSAAGQPYTPYTPHVPEDTGLIGSQLYMLAGGAFTSGFSVLSNVKAIRDRIK